jgi:hypothetical protein
MNTLSNKYLTLSPDPEILSVSTNKHPRPREFKTYVENTVMGRLNRQNNCFKTLNYGTYLQFSGSVKGYESGTNSKFTVGNFYH